MLNGFGGVVEQTVEHAGLLTTISEGAGRLSLTWARAPQAIFYRVWCGESPETMNLVADELTDTQYVITGLTGGTSYSVQVTAVMFPLRSLASIRGDEVGVATETQALTFIPGAAEPLTVAFTAEEFISAQGYIVVSVALSAAPEQPVRVDFRTQDGSGEICGGEGQPQCGVAGADYDAVSGTFAWSKGDTSTREFSVPDHNGRDWTAYVVLDNAVNAVVGSPNPARIGFRGV